MKINIGCGWRNFGEDWIHIDGGDYDHLDYKDITKLEFEDNSVDLIYASHVLEYFDRDEVIPVLEEWNRVLKKDGILRLAVPNFYAMIQLYFLSNYPLDTFLGPLYGKMKMADETIYHKTTYDWNSLCNILTEAGYKSFEKYNWQKPHKPNLTGTNKAYFPHKKKDAIEKKYKIWKK